MVQRIQKARSRHEFEREERLASETLGGGGNKKDLGTNVGGAEMPENIEAEDYDEENRQMLGGTPETGDTESIMAGSYEEDYGGGVQGRRNEGQTGSTARKPALRTKEKTIGGGSEDQEDFPTGKWSRQKARAKLSSTPGNAKATKESSRRRGETRASEEGGNRGRRAGETGSMRGRNAGGNRPRQTGMAGKPAASKERSQGTRGATPRRDAGSQRLGGRREKAASSPATARRQTKRNEGA